MNVYTTGRRTYDGSITKIQYDGDQSPTIIEHGPPGHATTDLAAIEALFLAASVCVAQHADEPVAVHTTNPVALEAAREGSGPDARSTRFAELLYRWGWANHVTYQLTPLSQMPEGMR